MNRQPWWSSWENQQGCIDRWDKSQVSQGDADVLASIATAWWTWNLWGLHYHNQFSYIFVWAPWQIYYRTDVNYPKTFNVLVPEKIFTTRMSNPWINTLWVFQNTWYSGSGYQSNTPSSKSIPQIMCPWKTSRHLFSLICHAKWAVLIIGLSMISVSLSSYRL